MAFRSTSHWKLMASRLRGSGGSAATFATSTSPKLKAYAPTANLGHAHDEKQLKKLMPPLRGDFVPVYVAMGMIALSMSLGLYTAKQQVIYSPSVRVRKKLRETIPEVVDPDRVVDEADKFVKKSFFRKVAHVQEPGIAFPVNKPTGNDAFVHERPHVHVETLKDVGIDPKQISP